MIWIFQKETGCQFFKGFKFGLKIVEILQKCCCSVDFLQEIALNNLVRANYFITSYYINLGTFHEFRAVLSNYSIIIMTVSI